MVLRAYLSEIAVRPGRPLVVHAPDVSDGRVEVWEYLHSDPHERGPGVLRTAADWGASVASSGPAATAYGSFASGTDVLVPGASFTLSLWLLPTDLSAARVVASWRARDQVCSLTLQPSADGGSRLVLTGDDRPLVVLDAPVRSRVWSFIGVTVAVLGSDAEAAAGAGEVVVFATEWGRTGGPAVSAPTRAEDVLPSSGSLALGTRAVDQSGGAGELDGRVAGPRVHLVALDIVDLMNVMNGSGPAPDVEWALEDRSDPDATPVLRTCPGAARGAGALRLVHAPHRSALVPLPVDDAGEPPAGTGAIHFHTDDVEDCGWPAAASIEVPADARPGVYVVELHHGDEIAELPMVVAGARTVTLMAPTLTWQAYANLGRDVEEWPGPSHYALHTDGSPVTLTTARKPTPTFRPGARLEVGAGDGFALGENATHLLMADLYAWHWLREEGLDGEPGLIDDRLLHEAGAGALEGVQVLVLSAHPEYWTTRMLDTVSNYLAGGGSIVYLGGNGLYWVTSLHPDKPHLMEVRRWGGSQTWSIEDVDRPHQFEDVVGGMWRDAGRPPNATVGVGFTGFGSGPSMEFTRTEESHLPAWAWVFEGVPGETFGGQGINQGAGNEFDRFDPAVPGPGESVVLASAQPASGDHFAAFEEGGARAPDPQVRADLVLTRTPAGGHVLAFSSITASGCLSSRDDDGVQRVLHNVIRRMLDGTHSADLA